MGILVFSAGAVGASYGGAQGGGDPMTLGAVQLAQAATESGEEPTREELEAQKERIEKHLLRVQAERFEAEARGEDPRTMKRLSREFRRTQQRRGEVSEALRTEGAE